MRKLIREYREAKVLSDMWDRVYMDDPEDIYAEQKWNEAYRDYVSQMNRLVSKIMDLTGGRINKNAARDMVVNHLDDLDNVVRRYWR